MWIGDSSDLIGDGTPLASVECSIGAYMDAIAVIMLEDGQPVLAKFRDGGGKPVAQNFIDGASVMHGAANVFLPSEHAIVQIYWGREDGKEPTISDCAGTKHLISIPSAAPSLRNESAAAILRNIEDQIGNSRDIVCIFRV
jgi:hypothetical protein